MCHLIFDVKIDFTRKAKFVAGGHFTDPPESITYCSVVSMETVHIAFLIAALNDLEFCAAYIGNAFLNAECKEIIWVKAGKEFGANEGKPMIIVNALYGLKSSGAAWGNLLSSSIKQMGFASSKANPLICITVRRSRRTGRSITSTFLYMLAIFICLLEDTKLVMNEIGELYRFNKGLAKCIKNTPTTTRNISLQI